MKKIGEIFKHKGNFLKCVLSEKDWCKSCYFKDKDCHYTELEGCSSDFRNGKAIHYELVDVVKTARAFDSCEDCIFKSETCIEDCQGEKFIETANICHLEPFALDFSQETLLSEKYPHFKMTSLNPNWESSPNRDSDIEANLKIWESLKYDVVVTTGLPLVAIESLGVFRKTNKIEVLILKKRIYYV